MTQEIEEPKKRFVWVKTDRDLNNRKPYRTKAQKAEARRTAKQVNGTWVSNAPVSYHPVKRDQMGLSKVELEEDL